MLGSCLPTYIHFVLSQTLYFGHGFKIVHMYRPQRNAPQQESPINQKNLSLYSITLWERLPVEIRTIPNRMVSKRNIHGLLLA